MEIKSPSRAKVQWVYLQATIKDWGFLWLEVLNFIKLHMCSIHMGHPILSLKVLIGKKNPCEHDVENFPMEIPLKWSWKTKIGI